MEWSLGYIKHVRGKKKGKCRTVYTEHSLLVKNGDNKKYIHMHTNTYTHISFKRKIEG